jgi:hypothetical protein
LSNARAGAQAKVQKAFGESIAGIQKKYGIRLALGEAKRYQARGPMMANMLKKYSTGKRARFTAPSYEKINLSQTPAFTTPAMRFDIDDLDFLGKAIVSGPLMPKLMSRVTTDGRTKWILKEFAALARNMPNYTGGSVVAVAALAHRILQHKFLVEGVPPGLSPATAMILQARSKFNPDAIPRAKLKEAGATEAELTAFVGEFSVNYGQRMVRARRSGKERTRSTFTSFFGSGLQYAGTAKGWDPSRMPLHRPFGGGHEATSKTPLNLLEAFRIGFDRGPRTLLAAERKEHQKAGLIGKGRLVANITGAYIGIPPYHRSRDSGELFSEIARLQETGYYIPITEAVWGFFLLLSKSFPLLQPLKKDRIGTNFVVPARPFLGPTSETLAAMIGSHEFAEAMEVPIVTAIAAVSPAMAKAMRSRPGVSPILPTNPHLPASGALAGAPMPSISARMGGGPDLRAQIAAGEGIYRLLRSAIMGMMR